MAGMGAAGGSSQDLYSVMDITRVVFQQLLEFNNSADQFPARLPFEAFGVWVVHPIILGTYPLRFYLVVRVIRVIRAKRFGVVQFSFVMPLFYQML